MIVIPQNILQPASVDFSSPSARVRSVGPVGSGSDRMHLLRAGILQERGKRKLVDSVVVGKGTM